MTITPTPPGESVEHDDSPSGTLAPPSPRNLFVVGLFDRGTTGQIADARSLTSAFGDRTSYSPAVDEIAVALTEGVSTPGTDGQSASVNVSRVVGPAAVAASVTLDAKVKVEASSPGQWGNALTAEITADGSARRLIVKQTGVAIATSPAFADVAELHAWSAEDPFVRTSSVAAGLPAATAATALTGGADDRANVDAGQLAAALDAFDDTLGPGPVIAPGFTDGDSHGAILEHCAARGRVAHLQLPADITEEDAIEHRQALAADFPGQAWRGTLWATHAWARALGGDPERLVGWAAIQAGLVSGVEGAYGLGAAPFGPRRGMSRTATRLYRDWLSAVGDPAGEVQRLYAQHVNVAQDTGRGIYAKGLRTLDTDPLREDAHVAGTRMRLAWRGRLAAEQYIGEATDMTSLGNYHSDLVVICEEFAKARAFNTDRDAGFRVSVDSVNTPTSLANRELYGRIDFRPNGSIHWTSIVVGARRPTDLI